MAGAARQDTDKGPDRYNRCNGNAESHSGKDSEEARGLCAGGEREPVRTI